MKRFVKLLVERMAQIYSKGRKCTAVQRELCPGRRCMASDPCRREVEGHMGKLQRISTFRLVGGCRHMRVLPLFLLQCIVAAVVWNWRSHELCEDEKIGATICLLEKVIKSKTLEKALALVRKYKCSGNLKCVITITSTTDFRKVISQV